jgi:hypothetical protein
LALLPTTVSSSSSTQSPSLLGPERNQQNRWIGWKPGKEQKGSFPVSLAEFLLFMQLSVANLATFDCVGLRCWLPSTHLIATDYHLFVPNSPFIGEKKEEEKSGSIRALFNPV